MSQAIRKLLLGGILATFSSSAWAAPVDLGDAGDFTLLGSGVPFSNAYAGTLAIGSAAHVFGSAGGRGHVSVSSGVTIDDNLYYGTSGIAPSVSVGGAQGTLSAAEWASLHQDVVDASSAASTVANQQALADITSSMTLTATPGTTSAFHVQGLFQLGSGESLILSGGFADQFVINVDGGMELASGAAITLSGGLLAENVLFNFPSASSTHAVNIGAAAFSGNFIAPHMSWTIGDGTTMPATRVLASGISANIQDMTPPAAVPEPGTAVLLLAGLLVLTRRQR